MAFTVEGIVVPDDTSGRAVWMRFYADLKKKFGRSNAQNIWLAVWERIGNVRLTADPTFLQFTRKNGLPVSNTITRTWAGVESFVSMPFNLLKWGVPIIILVAGVPIVMSVINLRSGAGIAKAAGKVAKVK